MVITDKAWAGGKGGKGDGALDGIGRGWRSECNEGWDGGGCVEAWGLNRGGDVIAVCGQVNGCAENWQKPSPNHPTTEPGRVCLEG